MSDPSDPTDPAAPPRSPSPSEPTRFDRGISPISGRLGAGLGGKAVVLAALTLGCGLFVAATWRSAPKPDRSPPEAARQVVPFEPLVAPTPPTLSAPGPGAPSLDGAQAAGAPSSAKPADTAAARQAQIAAVRAAPLLAYSQGGGGAQTLAPMSPAVTAVQSAVSASATELEQLRRGSAIGQARATRLADRNFLILAGTQIPCILQTAMDTATPGYVSCLIPHDVLSDNGAVVLLEKGAKVLGEYRSSLRQGQNRLFVLWTRAVTPQGVAIDLASPATDPLGRAGFDGELDTHFWARFGGALLLSIVDDGASALTRRDGGAGAVRLPSDAPAAALQNSINTAPSLRKAQGAEVSIFVAQDFDFSGVYGLEASPAP